MDYPKRVITLGERDPEILKAIQDRLNDLGLGPIPNTDKYEPKTVAIVKLFQATHRDQNGNPLVIDGKIGPITWTALFGPENFAEPNENGDEISMEAINVALSQVGVMENPPGSNKGPEVNEYLASVDCPPGSSGVQHLYIGALARPLKN